MEYLRALQPYAKGDFADDDSDDDNWEAQSRELSLSSLHLSANHSPALFELLLSQEGTVLALITMMRSHNRFYPCWAAEILYGMMGYTVQRIFELES
mmetsp:Transcript_32665/g.45346  ORF Transcript_32665/g.45346 Transcript_32665/m.45346 type:complete len:97 (+) Transcript_32665:98-388(+)|eukprot:CAMPEP_0196572642 /NCGR_PEP_ID=MMETSP1081-20130531/2647_1 /TAXON_ID=36882 /ORGANISM="Pyramimonas amylifera, Strain CCMP720" /LENGTH=96 /DNA_ID=CAMNT_0041890021 /DNA_START=97 /DNA_END=387 /DNA_ORIENTATION=-